MSDIISILPDAIANQIAAGEVVDRPAGAVKELLENAIDAGATRIQLILRDAGRTLIQVIDNGCGMSDTDARLCFERHATSKIHASNDLFAIRTMGFRGEALPSIAAIAQVELKTRLHDNELGTRVVIEGSAVKQQEPCSCPIGTSIAVKNLFFNVPARRNFLKKDSVELSHIEEVFRRVAIINHDIEFSLYHNDRPLYELKPGNMALRVSNLFGKACNERMYPIEEATDVVRLRGYVSKPENARKTRGEQYLFVNNRYIRNAALSAAIERAYDQMIPDHYYPSYFVALEVPPDRIDVNIHPTKTEVKFADDQVLFAILRAATRKALGQFSLATEIEFNPAQGIDFTPLKEGQLPVAPTVRLDPTYNPFSGSSGRAAGGNSGRGGGVSSAAPWNNFFNAITPDEERAGGPLDSEKHPEDEAPAMSATTAPIAERGTGDGEAEAERRSSLGFDSAFDDGDDAGDNVSPVPFQFARCYIVSTIKSGILVVHQQYAHERILFERLMAQRQQVVSQQLLFPVNCTFSPADSELFKELMPQLATQGFVVDVLGTNTFVVSATPSNLDDNDLQALFDQLIINYKSAMLQKFSDKSRTLCLTLARHSAVKAGQPLQPEEMQQIIADLFSCQVPNISPSGKRTITVIRREDIDGRFNNKF